MLFNVISAIFQLYVNSFISEDQTKKRIVSSSIVQVIVFIVVVVKTLYQQSFSYSGR